MDNGFTFGARHSLHDMRCFAVRQKGRVISAPGSVPAYEIGGVQGTVAWSQRRELQPYQETVTLYALDSIDTLTDATRKWREIERWLLGGRKWLIWDCEPDRMQAAEVTQMAGESGSWVQEGLRLTLQVQPLMYAVRPWVRSVSVSDNAPAVIPMMLDTQHPAPVSVSVTGMGADALDALTLRVGQCEASLRDLALGALDTLEIGMTPPIGATILRADGRVDNALPLADRFDQLLVERGGSMTVQAAWKDGAADTRCTVRVTARGVFG